MRLAIYFIMIEILVACTVIYVSGDKNKTDIELEDKLMLKSDKELTVNEEDR